jgi:hypothetical protein
MARDSVSISIKPTIAPPKHSIKAWQAAERVERPCPPDLPCHIGMRWHPIPIFQCGSTLVCRPADSLARFASCRQQTRTASLSAQILVVQLLSSISEPNERRTRIPHRKVSIPREGGQVPIHGLAISLNSPTREDDHGRAICYKRAVRLSLKNCCEFVPIKSVDLAFKSSFSGRPYLPRNMRDVIFDATTGSLRRITPVVFGNELFQTPLLRLCRNAYSLSREGAPVIADLPLILGPLVQLFRFNVVPHRKVFIVLPIYQASGCGNCASGHHLGDKGNSSSIIAAFFATNVEA